MEKIINAKIKSALLGFQINQSFSYQIFFDTGETELGIVGDFPINSIVEVLTKLLKIVEVENWVILDGKYIRIKIKDNKIIAIGNLLKDNWFYFYEKNNK